MRPNLRGFFTNNLINVSVAIAGLMLVGMTAVLAWQAYSSHAKAQQLQTANQVTDELLRASAHQARERGLTSAALGGEVSPEALAKLQRARTTGDQYWRDALTLAGNLSVSSATSAIEVHRTRAEAAWKALQEARALADQSIDTGRRQIEADEWFDAATQVIDAGASLSRQILLSADAPIEVTQLNSSVQRSAWRISEMMGQIRAILSFHSGTGAPLPPAQMRLIKSNLSVIDKTVDELLLLRNMPETSNRLLAHLDTIEETLEARFKPDLKAMLAGGDTGTYPMESLEWYDAATAAIDEVIGTSRVVSDVTEAQVDSLARHDALAFGGFSLFALLASLLAASSMVQVRNNANALFLQKELAETTLDSIGDAVITTDSSGHVEYLNPVAEELTGWSTAEAKGRLSSEILHVQNTLHASLVDPIGTCLREGHVVGLTNGHVLVRRDGRRVGIEDSAAPIRDRDANVVGCVVVFYSTDASGQAEHLLSYHATRDALTGLINRREFERRLQSAVEDARADGSHHVLAYLDLDQFKVVNDTCGHAAGDRMLRQITFLLRKRIRDSDTLARLGGDEFALLLNNCSMEKAMEVLEEVRRTLRAFRFNWERKIFEISVSIGATPITYLSASQSELLSQADAACYAAKATGRNRIRVFHPDDAELSQQQSEMHWVTEITDALREKRLELYCQPLLPLRPGLPKRVEILVRLRMRNGTLAPPMAFIPAAERYNLMADVDRWVIRNACEALASSEIKQEDTVLNLNLSGLSLSDSDLPRFICKQSQEYKIRPETLCFEITETAAVGNIDTVLELIQPLIDQGYSFALDDFGTGLSSLTYLKNLPIQQIKIDGSFVRNLTSDPFDRAMIESVGHIAKVLGVAVTAEFVEDQATLDALRKLRIDYAQGYAVGRPMPLQDYLAGEPEIIDELCSAWN